MLRRIFCKTVLASIMLTLGTVAAIAAQATGAELLRIEIKGTNVNLRAQPSASGAPVRKASSPESFIAERGAVVDSSGAEWLRIVYSFNEINECVHGVELYVSAAYAAGAALDARIAQKVRDYESARRSFDTGGEWEGMGPDESQEPTVETFAWADARVYAEPSPHARVVGTLPRSPGGAYDTFVNDVFISGARVKRSGNSEVLGPFDIWWRVERPIAGWVEGPAIGVYNSGLLSGD